MLAIVSKADGAEQVSLRIIIGVTAVALGGLLIFGMCRAEPRAECAPWDDAENYLTDLEHVAKGEAAPSGRSVAEVIAEAHDLLSAGMVPPCQTERLLEAAQ